VIQAGLEAIHDCRSNHFDRFIFRLVMPVKRKIESFTEDTMKGITNTLFNGWPTARSCAKWLSSRFSQSQNSE
jgi:hypothetical protein